MRFNLNEEDKFGRTALFHAINSLNIEMFKFLIEKGANRVVGKELLKDLKNFYNTTFVHKEKAKEMIELVKKYGVK